MLFVRNRYLCFALRIKLFCMFCISPCINTTQNICLFTEECFVGVFFRVVHAYVRILCSKNRAAYLLVLGRDAHVMSRRRESVHVTSRMSIVYMTSNTLCVLTCHILTKKGLIYGP